MSTVRPDLSVALFCLTPGGVALARRLRPHLNMSCFTSPTLIEPGFIPFDGGFASALRQAFGQYDRLIVIGATGVTVRVLAPVLHDKLTDPAVVVLDEQGQFAISLLSGHLGGANQLARQLADILGGQAVITTATDVNNMAALDQLAGEIDGRIDNFRDSVKTVNQMLVSGKKVGIWWHPALVAQKERVDTRGFVPVEDLVALPELDGLVYISYHREMLRLNVPTFKLVPRRVVVGIGCRRGVDPVLVAQMLSAHLADNDLDPLALKAIGSVELKRDEPALNQLARSSGVPFQLFPVSALSELEHLFPVSDFVRQTVGAGCVSQPVAWLLSGGNITGHTLKQQGVTMTLGVLA